jgi:Flp pilus assembly protein TadG
MRRFIHAQDGAIAAISAVSLVVILGFGAFAIDMSYAYSERNLLQVTADAAALAAAPELPNKNKAREMALEYVEDNMPAATHGIVLDKEDVVLGNWDTVSETWSPNVGPLNAVEVTTRRSSDNGNRLDLFLAPILGLGSLDMETSAVAYAQAPTGWDVALVQDVTHTFFDEIDEAREADQALLNCVSDNFSDARMGLTAFTGTATEMTKMLPVGRPGNDHNRVKLEDAIDNLNACVPEGMASSPPMPPCSGTHVGIGIEAAIKQLDNYVPADSIVGQAIVIVGDGISQVRSDGIGQEYYDQSAYFVEENCELLKCKSTNLAHMADRAADDAEDKGYDIFVIYLEDENLSNAKIEAAAAFFEGLVRGAGQFFRTPNADELVELVPDLCFRARDLQLVM